MGLLDILNTPQGMGLLSAVAGGMAGARRGAPINSIGRGLVTGVAGYQGAQQQLRDEEENALTKQYRQMQMQKIESDLAQQKAQREWKAGLPAVMKNRTQQVAPNENTQLMAASMGSQAAPEVVDNSQAVQDYLMQPDSPYADKLIEQQIMPSTEKPQLVTVYENGRPVQKWLRPGEADGVSVGMGKPEAESYKERTVSPDGRTYIKQYSQDGGQTWQQIEGTRPYDIRASSGGADVTVNAFPKETFKNERDLRNDFQGLPTTKAFREVQTSYDQIRFALKNPSAANDLAAATKFMKLLDPGSVVRESELGMAMAATGQFDRMSNYYNMLKTGQKLTPSQRVDFYNSANGLYKAATDRYNESATEFRTMAQDYQLNPDRIAKPAAIEKPDNKPAPARKLSPSEQQELQQLRARFKK